MQKKLAKVSYNAPRLEATSFMTERGYATSGVQPQPVKTFTLGVGQGSL